MQQQLAAADGFQIEAGVQLPAGLQQGGFASGAKVHRLPRQQIGQHPRRATDRQQQVAAAAAGQPRHPAQHRVAQADRRVRRPQAQVQAGLVGEFGVGRHHHIGVLVGLRQIGLGHQGPKFRRRPHPQHPLILAALQFGFIAGRQFGGGHGASGRGGAGCR